MPAIEHQALETGVKQLRSLLQGQLPVGAVNAEHATRCAAAGTTRRVTQWLTSSTLRDACDCHLHVYERRLSVGADSHLQATPRAGRGVIARFQRRFWASAARSSCSPPGYGFDNRCTLAAIQALGPQARGIAVIPPDSPQAELSAARRWHARRAIHDAGRRRRLPWSSLEPMAERIATGLARQPAAWTAAICRGSRRCIAGLRCPVAIDHIGKIPRSGGCQRTTA